MAIETNNPITIPPTIQEKVFNKVWFTNINIQAQDLYNGTNNEPRAVIQFKLYNDTDGFAPSEPKTFIIDKLFTKSATSQKVALAMQSLFEALEEQGKEQNQF